VVFLWLAAISEKLIDRVAKGNSKGVVTSFMIKVINDIPSSCNSQLPRLPSANGEASVAKFAVEYLAYARSKRPAFSL
jgi:hypothetical protein